MRLAVVGCGSIGSRYAEWLAGMEGVTLAVLDQDVDQAKRIAASVGASQLESLDDMAQWSADGVLVATPPPHHVDAAIAALDSGAAVLVEKPIAHNLAAARRLVEHAEGVGGMLYVVCNMRFHPGPRTLKRHLGEIGRPLAGRAHFGHRLSQMRPQQTHQGAYARSAAQGGGVVLDCIHEIDYHHWLFGPLDYVHGWPARLGEETVDAEDYASILARFESGYRVAIHLDYHQRIKRRGCEIIGTEGTLIWESEGKIPEHCRVRLLTSARQDVLLDEHHVEADIPYRHMLDSFIAAIKGGDGDAVLQSGREGLMALESAMEALQGSRTGEGAA